MLYTPSLYSKQGFLQIAGPGSPTSTRARRSLNPGRTKHVPKSFSRLKQDLQLVDQNLPSLLKVFGNILPESQPSLSSGQITPSASQQRPLDAISVSNICFYTLHNLTNITIQWVDCLSLHLDYDGAGKVLRLYRFPSLCLLMCFSDESCFSQ